MNRTIITSKGAGYPSAMSLIISDSNLTTKSAFGREAEILIKKNRRSNELHLKGRELHVHGLHHVVQLSLELRDGQFSLACKFII